MLTFPCTAAAGSSLMTLVYRSRSLLSPGAATHFTPDADSASSQSACGKSIGNSNSSMFALIYCCLLAVGVGIGTGVLAQDGSEIPDFDWVNMLLLAATATAAGGGGGV